MMKLESRKLALQCLVELGAPLSKIKIQLLDYPWDSESAIVMLAPTHLVNVLARFLDGSISSELVEEWANLVEGRDDIGLEANSSTLLVSVIHDLANPYLNGELTREKASDWIRRLEQKEES